LVGAAVGAVVVVAAVDAVRNRGDAEPPAATTTELEDRDALSAQAEALGVRGELLVYGDGCRVRRLELPSLEWTGDDASGCGPQGVVSPDGSAVARCAGDVTEVLAAVGGPVAYTVRGCIPAWRPDGTLTFARDNEVVRHGGNVLIPRAQLERAARRHPTVPDIPVRVRALVDGIAWISDTRAAVLLSIRIGGRLDRLGPLSAIAFFENGYATSARPYLGDTGGQLDVSPRGTFVTMTRDVILRRDGSQVSLPPHLREGHAFAWSDNERFLAIATPFAVTIVDVTSLARFDRIGSGLRSVTLPLSVTELAWR